MTAFASPSGTIYIQERGQSLAGYALGSRDPRACVDLANAKLRTVKVTGDDGLAWQARRRVAVAVLEEVAREVVAP